MCRLISPPEAERCDCGYDFGSGQVRGSYLAAEIADKRRTAGFRQQTSRSDMRRGALLIALGIGTTALLSWIANRLEAEGGGTPTFGLILVGWGVVSLLRGASTAGDTTLRRAVHAGLHVRGLRVTRERLAE